MLRAAVATDANAPRRPSAGSFTYVQDDKILWVNCYIISYFI